MNIYLYFTDLLKMLPSSGKPIKEIHANTAFTTFCKPTTEIHLFREEEWFKVLIHETFHSLGLDFSEFDHSDTNKQILSIFPVNSDVRIFETYCETWAELLNTMFIVFYSTDKSPDLEKLIKKTEGLLDQERMFSLFQCVKILDFYGLDYSDLYERTQAAHLRRLYRYKENTHVLSYYILKSIFIFFINDFVEWCVDHNNKSLLNFNKTPSILNKNMEEYCGFIKEHYNRNEYTALIKLIDSWYENLRDENLRYEKINFNNNNIIELKTLRMTILEQ
jgi:hypothetical protein